MRGLTRNLGLAVAVLGLAALTAGASKADIIYFQGFETNNDGWNVFGGDNNATRVLSGTNGVPSEEGSYHAEVAQALLTDDGSGATNWGGYSSVFPAGGYTTSLGIYLNLDQTTTNDTRFDYSSAINNSSGGFLRDFVFNGGFYNDGSGNVDRFIVSASNNAGRANSYPKNPQRNPITITETGWYDFEHTFYDNSGVLAVNMSIINHATSAVVGTWTLSNASDLISGVGGNRYGWIASNEFSFLAIDNATLSAVPEPSSALISGTAAVMLCLGFALRRRNTAKTAA